MVAMESALVRTMNVLLVEDDLVHAKLMRRAMRGFDQLQITHVADGDAAIDALIAGEEIDLILLDLRLPRRDGFEVLEAVRSGTRTKQVPVVIVSTSDRPDEIARSYKLGANAYVCKPVEFEQMIAAVRAMAAFWIRTITQSPPNVGWHSSVSNG